MFVFQPSSFMRAALQDSNPRPLLGLLVRGWEAEARVLVGGERRTSECRDRPGDGHPEAARITTKVMIRPCGPLHHHVQSHNQNGYRLRTWAQSCPTLQPHGACQAPLYMGYWSRLPFPFPGDLPEPGIKPMFPVSLASAGSFFLFFFFFFTTVPPGKPVTKRWFLSI